MIHDPADHLIPHLRFLREQILQYRSDKADFTGYRSEMAQLEKLPYSLGSMCLSLVEFTSRLRLVADRALLDCSPGTVRLVEAQERDAVAYYLDGFLDSCRRAQNALIPYISKVERVSIPKSLAQLLKNHDRSSETVSPPVLELLHDYWERNGHNLKNYRDLAQHYGIVSSDCRVSFAPTGQPIVHLILPNNPEAKSLPDLKWEEPTVHAFEFLRTQFAAFLSVSYRLTHRLLKSEVENRSVHTAGVMFSTPIRLGASQQVGHPLSSVESVNADIEQQLERLYAETHPDA